MRVVGVDQSYTAFGHCIDGLAKKKGFPASKYDGQVARLIAIRDWLYDWLDEIDSDDRIDLVCMEGYAFGAKAGREMAGELGGTVKTVVYDFLGPDKLLVVPPTSLKKFVTGSGSGKKATMIMHIYKRWGLEFSDDNQADAFALEKFGEAYLDPGAELPKFQQEAIDKVRHLV